MRREEFDVLREKAGATSGAAALVIATALAAALASGWLSLLFALPFHALPLCGLTAVTAATAAWTLRRIGVQVSVASVVSALAVLAGSVVAAAFVMDTSYDGQVYHMLAVDALRRGWNPLYHPEYPDSVWVEHYPKGSWLIAAYIYAFVPTIEAGKAINLAAAAGAFFAAHASALAWMARREPGRREVARLRGMDRPASRTSQAAAFVVALAAAANPVASSQLFTYYNDGLLGSLLLMYAASLARFSVTRDRGALVTAMFAAIVLVNVKFTALVYAALFGAAFAVYEGWRAWARGRASDWVKAVGALAAAGVVGAAVFGFNPYVTNTVRKGHPFYPLEGKGKIDIVTANMPGDFVGRSKWDKFYLSLTGRPSSPIRPASSERRASFWDVRPDEFRKLDPDTRVAGFGPYMHWLLLGAALVVLATVATDVRVGIGVLLLAAVPAATVAVNPENWWARYVPQLWWVPALAAAGGWMARARLAAVPRTATICLAALLLWNAGGSAAAAVARQVDNSLQLDAQLDALRKENAELRLFREGLGFVSVPLRFRERGIRYVAVSRDGLCPNPQKILFSTAHYCKATDGT